MVIESQKIIFIHCCKTGGSSVLAGFFANDGINMKQVNRLPADIAKKYWVQESWKHAPALKLKKDLQEKFDEYYKFSMIRNPWDRFMSQTNWVYRPKHDPSGFKKFRDDFRDTTFSFWEDRIYNHRSYWPMTFMLCDKEDNLLVDEVFDITEMKKVTEKFGIAEFRKKEANSRSSFAMFDEYDWKRFDDIVTKLYKKDIEYFNYDRSPFVEDRLDEDLI